LGKPTGGLQQNIPTGGLELGMPHDPGVSTPSDERSLKDRLLLTFARSSGFARATRSGSATRVGTK
jgi:hypothetical protein